MDEKKIARINFLAKKSKTPEGLTEQELLEQKALRKEYIDSYVRNLKAQLDNTYIQDEQGNKTKLKKKDN